MAIAEFDGFTPPTHIVFEKAAFWVRMYNLPLACMGLTIRHQIGATVGTVEEKLPNFYYQCGVVCHGRDGCRAQGVHSKLTERYPVWPMA